MKKAMLPKSGYEEENKMKRFTFISFVICMVLWCCMALAASSGTCGDNTVWTLDDAGILTISGKGAVTNSSSDWGSCKKLIVKNGVTSLTELILYGNTNLKSVALADSVVSIGKGAFYRCTGLETVSFGKGLKTIDESAFWGCSKLSELTFPSGLVNIGTYGFAECISLREITLPPSLKEIGGYCFYSCTQLRTVHFNSGLESIGENCFGECGSLTEIILPDSLTFLGSSAFYTCTRIASIYVPGSLKTLSNTAFSGCTGITEVVIGEGLESVVGSVWNMNHGIRDFYLPESLTYFDTLSYGYRKGSSLYTVTPTVHCYRGSYAETWAKGISANISYRPRLTGSGVCDDNMSWQLYDNGELQISGSGTLRSSPWNTDAVTDVYLSGGITAIGPSVFQNCTNLTNVTLDTGLTSIGEETFLNCQNLKAVWNTNQLSHIGQKAFYNCTSLSTFILGNNTSIGQDAFSNCDMLFEKHQPKSQNTNPVTHEFGLAGFREESTGARLTPEEAMRKYLLECTLYEYADGSRDVYISNLSGNAYLSDVKLFDPQTYMDSNGLLVITGDYEYPVPGGSLRVTYVTMNGIRGYSIGFEPHGIITLLENQESTLNATFGILSSLKLDRIETSNTIQYREEISVNTVAELHLYENGYAKLIDTSGCANYRSYTSNNEGYTIGTTVFHRVTDGEFAVNNGDGSVSYYIDIEKPYSKDHEHDSTISPAVAATCEAAGLSEGRYCSICGKVFVEQETVPALGHNWNTPIYTWSDDHKSVTAVRTCSRDHSHKETETVGVTSSIVKDPTCTVKGKTQYTSKTFLNSAFAVQNLTLEDIPATGHAWNAPVYQWSTDNSQVTATRSCAKDSTHSESETVQTTKTVIAPDCENDGSITHISQSFKNGAFTIQTKTVAGAGALGHLWADPVYSWNDNHSELTAIRHCYRDPMHIETETVPATKQTVKAVSCETDGEIAYFSDNFANGAFAAQGVTLSIPATGHSWSEPVYTWAENRSNVTASHICQNDATHTETETALLSEAMLIRRPTEESEGELEFVSEAFANPFFGAQTLKIAIPSKQQSGFMKLPNMLERIEEEAFVSILSDYVEIPYGCQEIGPRAFADSAHLRYADVPSSVTAIAGDSFENDDLLTMLVESGSYAHQYAEDHQIPYAVLSEGLIPHKYTVAYVANGGTWAPENQTKLEGTGLRLASAIPKNDCSVTLTYGNGTEPETMTVSAVFTGWNTEADGSGTHYNAGSIYSDDEPLVLFAQWEYRQVGELPIPDRDGYLFDGWFTAQDGGKQVDSSFAVTQDTTIYAHWHVRGSYTVAYYDNGGEGAPENQEKAERTDLTLSSVVPTNAYSVTIYPENGGDTEHRNGNAVFLGWNTEPDGTGKSYKPGDIYSDDTSVVLCAQWEQVLIGPLPQLEREGYVFAGWFTAKTGGTEVNADTEVQGNVSVYARWKQLFAVSFDANGGKDAPAEQVFTEGQPMILSSDIPTKEHTVFFHENHEAGTDTEQVYAATFEGWNTEPDGSGKMYSPGDSYAMDATEIVLYAQWSYPELEVMPEPVRAGYRLLGWYAEPDADPDLPVERSELVTENRELYAQWKKTYSVQYEGAGGTGIPDEQVKLEGEDLLLSETVPVMSFTVTFNTGNSEVTVREYPNAFLSWNTAPDGTGEGYQPGDVYSRDADATLYAQWAGVVYGELPEPSRYGYRFNGWYTSASGGTEIHETTSLTGDAVVYAHWIKVAQYSVLYSANGGTNAPSSQTKLQGIDLVLAQESPVKTYTITYVDDNGNTSEQTVYAEFKGWNTASNGSGTGYQPGDTYTRDATVYLYAQWQNTMLEPIAAQEKDGYSFLGWFTDAEEGELVDTSTVVNADMTLYARYELITVSSGTCGTGVNWVLYGNGHLEISGNGSMDDYMCSDNNGEYKYPPWSGNKVVSEDKVVSVFVGPGVTTIGMNAFIREHKLSQVELSEGLVTIRDYAFTSSDITSIDFPSTLRSIGIYSFRNCELTSVVLPEGFTQLDLNSFAENHSLESVTLPSTMTGRLFSSFENCNKLVEVDIPYGVTSIESSFKGCTGLERVSIPASVTTITGAFYNCKSLKTVTLPEGVQFIGSSAFEGCSALTEITIPRSVTFIYDNAIPSTAVIKCFQDSYAATWATSHGYQVVYLQ